MGRPDARSEIDTIDHVLRGALNVVLLNLELLAPALAPDEKNRAVLERAASGLKRLATELLPTALGIMRLEVSERRPVDLAALAARACAEHGLKGPPHPGPPVSGDADLLALAVGHLIGGAVAATPPGAPPFRSHSREEMRRWPWSCGTLVPGSRRSPPMEFPLPAAIWAAWSP
jgi:signal transduction histidine kinase